jgi:hypothetical protein
MITIQKSTSGAYFTVTDSSGITKPYIVNDYNFIPNADGVTFSLVSKYKNLVSERYYSGTTDIISNQPYTQVTNGDTSSVFADFASLQTYILTNFFRKAGGGSSSSAWGSITGTLSSQADLQSALDAKAFSLTVVAVKTAGYTAVVDDFVPVDTTSGNVTITLPATPADKALVGVKQVIRGGTNTVSVVCGGSDVFNKTGGGTSLTLTLLNQGALLQYKASAGIWYILSDDLSLAQLDNRYAPIASSSVVSPVISLLNITSMQAFGDSFTIGYGTTGTYTPFAMALGVLINSGVSNWGVSNTGVVNSTNSGFSHISANNKTQLTTWMSGLNDLRQNGATTACLAQITGNLTSFLVNAFSHYQASGGGSGNIGSIGTFTKTGTWTTSAVTSYSGKSQYLSPATAAASSTSGSSLSFAVDANTETIAIGTFSDDGTGPNALGAFSIYIDGVLYLTYTPTGRNTGIANPAPTSQGRMPEAILVPGVAGRTITITTNSNTLTLIDYIAALNYPQNCAPVLVYAIPKMTSTGYASAPANANDAVINAGNVVVQNVVSLFKSLPVYYIDTNSFYTPNSTYTQADGIHPNTAGHQQIAYGTFQYFQGNTALYTGNDFIINQLTVGQGHNSSGAAGFNVSGAVLGNSALQSNTSGAQMIAIGGLAGQSITGGAGCVMIGYFAFGSASGAKNNVTAVGYEAGVSVNTNYDTFLGALSIPVDITLSNCVVISDGQGVTRFEYKPDVGQTTLPASSAVVPAGAMGVGRLSAISGTPSITPSNTGGTMNAGTYFYKIVAVDYLGNVTTPSTQVSATVSGSGTNSIALSWSAVVGAISYRIYRGITTNGQNGYWTSVTNSYTDVAATGLTAGAVNAFNSSVVACLNQDGSIYGNNVKINAINTLVSGSTSGTANFGQPSQGSSYKKVLAYCSALLGTASYTFPVPFINTPAVITTNGPASSVVTSLSTTAVTITGATTTGFVVLEGY